MKNGPTLKIWHSPIPEFFCHVHFRCFKCFFGFCFVFFLCVCVFFFVLFFLVCLVFFSCVLLFFFLFAWCGSSSVLTWQCGLLCVAGVPFWRGSVVSCAWQVFFSDVAVWCPFHGCEKTRKKHTQKIRKRKEKNKINKYIWSNLKWMWKNSSAAYVGYTAPIQNWGTSNFKGWSVFHGRVPC